MVSDVFSHYYTTNSYEIISRSDNPILSGNRSLLWLKRLSNTDSTKIAIINPCNENMENIFDENTFYAGTDNIFGNQGNRNGNNNNIERQGVIFPNDLLAAQKNKASSEVFEGGADNAHDLFVIAPSTAIDASGNPTAYGNIIKFAASHYSNITATASNYFIVRRYPAAQANLRLSASVTRNMDGLFLSFNDLGIDNNIKIFGYCLLLVYLPTGAVPGNLVNYSDSTFFARNTASSKSLSGLDLLGITGIFGIPNSMLIPPVAYDVTLAPISQALTIYPFIATATNTTIKNVQ